MNVFSIRTEREGLYNITGTVRAAVSESGVQSGICLVYCPHTTAAITINENADPDVKSDLCLALDHFFPDLDGYRHAEGNSAAHLKASLIGESVLIPIERGEVTLGTWQGVYFCEFDGPRDRKFFVKILGN